MPQPKLPDGWEDTIPCPAYRVRTKNVFVGPREGRGLHEFKIHCIGEFGHEVPHFDPTGRTW